MPRTPKKPPVEEPGTKPSRPDPSEVELQVESLEERIAPRLAANHNEALLRDR